MQNQQETNGDGPIQANLSGPGTVVNMPTFRLEDLRSGTTNLVALAAQYREMEIALDDEVAIAGDIVKELNAAIKKIEGERKELGAPIMEAKKRLDRRAQEIAEPIRAALGVVKAALNRYAARQAEEQKKAQKIVDDAIIAAAERADKEGRKDDADRVLQHGSTMAPTKPKEPIRGEAATISTRKTWKFEVVDKAQVPDDYKIINESAVRNRMRAQLKADERPRLDGIRFWQEEEISIR